MDPSKDLYCRRFRPPVGWFEVGLSSFPDIIYDALEKIQVIRDRRFRPPVVFILSINVLRVDEDLSFEEVLVEILDRQVKKFRNIEVHKGVM